MGCFSTQCSFANVLSAPLFLLTSGLNRGRRRLAEWNVTDVPKQDGARVKVERLQLVELATDLTLLQTLAVQALGGAALPHTGLSFVPSGLASSSFFRFDVLV
jgi:hypothetical protein